MGEEYNQVHPVEQTAHAVLSGSLDSLSEHFELLNQSQLILLTRLNIIEEKLLGFQSVVKETGDEKRLLSDLARMKEMRRRVSAVIKTLAKVDQRIERIK